MDIIQSIYGIPQAGSLANKGLEENLAPNIYFEFTYTPGLWQHITRPIYFPPVVYDFGVKYVDKAYVDHLIATQKNTMKYLNIV